ncbi:hypothetical protein HZA43_01545 [Candidatus Peregrinibacteria bacterium]|nr:hypothetical protein [Candidatus Peregrinibacteria bacterium]
MFKKTFLLLVAVLALTGCGSAPTPPDISQRAPVGSQNIAASSPVSFEGTIQSIKLSLYQKGTHLLTTKQGKEIIIASPTINLNTYINKDVVVGGVYESGADDSEKVFIITSAPRLGNEEGVAAGLKDYKNSAFGIRFSYSGSLTLDEEGVIMRLKKESLYTIIALELFNVKSALADFIKTREVEDGASISVAGQPAFRFAEGGNIRVYVGTPKGRIIRLSFLNATPETLDQDRQMFYGLLESLTFLSYAKATGPECGGSENKSCDAGFRCELESGEKDAKGVCVDINAVDTQSVCPFVPPPKDCRDFQVSDSNSDGCPVSYKCLDTAPPPDKEPSSTATTPPPISTAPTTTKDSKPPASTSPLPTTDYRLPTTDLGRTYENTFKNFKISYHKNWYFKSFGAADDALWVVGFSDRALVERADALIVLKIANGVEASRRGKAEGGVYTFLLPRDSASHFILEGPSSFQSLIEEMAQSLS